MAFRCTSCGKKTNSGHNVSHSHKSSNRTFKPNLQKIRIILGGSTKSAYVCTRCIKSGKVVKAG